MPANFDGTNAEIQPNKNTEDMNNRKNKENNSNEEQISEKKRAKMEQIMGQLSFYGPPKINANRRFRINPYGQQQEKEDKETTYGKFIHW